MNYVVSLIHLRLGLKFTFILMQHSFSWYENQDTESSFWRFKGKEKWVRLIGTYPQYVEGLSSSYSYFHSSCVNQWT